MEEIIQKEIRRINKSFKRISCFVLLFVGIVISILVCLKNPAKALVEVPLFLLSVVVVVPFINYKLYVDYGILEKKMAAFYVNRSYFIGIRVRKLTPVSMFGAGVISIAYIAAQYILGESIGIQYSMKCYIGVGLNVFFVAMIWLIIMNCLMAYSTEKGAVQVAILPYLVFVSLGGSVAFYSKLDKIILACTYTKVGIELLFLLGIIVGSNYFLQERGREYDIGKGEDI